MTSSYWFIDSALNLHPVDTLPSGVSRVNRPEQLVDTLLLRNLNTLSTQFFQCPAKFLFHSTEYWGPFDVGCLLSDGSLGAFESKSKSLNKKGFDKFCRDIRTVKSSPDEYIRHRFQHVLTALDEYIATAERMFAGFFLGVRCDTQPMCRDLTSEASRVLSVDRESFVATFHKGNDWLESLRNCQSLDECAAGFASRLVLGSLVPLLLVPDACVYRVESWLTESIEGDSVTAILGSYQLFADDVAYPRWLATTIQREFRVPLES